MAFEKNPEFKDGGIKSQQSWREWLTENERALFAVTGILLVIVLVMSVRVLGGSLFLGEPGGLDGCIVNAAGEPMIGTAQVDASQRPTSADGCFYFAELSPGEHELTIKASDGYVTIQSVEIISGQAVGLGTITLQ
jgi:hypothetical protein